jgi:hypothetical protein
MSMTRRGIILAYKVLGPFGLLIAFLGALDTLGVIDLSERGLPDPLFGIAAGLTYLMAFSIPVLVVLCPIIIFRFRRDLPVMLPALLMVLALFLLFGPLFAGFDEVAPAFGWIGGLLLLGSALTAIWAGYFTPARPEPARQAKPPWQL